MLPTIKRTKTDAKPWARLTTKKIRAGLLALLVGAFLPPMVINAQAYDLPDGMPDSFGNKANYTLFETVPVRPMVMSNSGDMLYVLNTMDDRLEMFSITDSGLTHTGDIAVGMRPVALAEAPDGRNQRRTRQLADAYRHRHPVTDQRRHQRHRKLYFPAV